MDGAAGDRKDALKETILESLTAILSNDHLIRSSGENRIKALEVTEEFGTFLVELTVNGNLPLSIRQLASVLLKQYVECHWTKHSDKFREPETTNEAKAHIRQMLPVGLSEPISKVRSSVSYAISAIAHWDWPEEWPELFPLLMQALTSSKPDAVHGAMRVLSEFSQDITDTQTDQIAPIILPELHKILIERQLYSIRTRSRAVDIFTVFVGMFAAMDDLKQSIGKQLLMPILPRFLEAFLHELQVPDSATSDCGLKKAIISALTVLLKSFHKLVSPFMPQILPCIWNMFTQSAHFYVLTVVNNVEDGNDPVDSDGEVLGFESLVHSVFEFVHTLCDRSGFRSTVKGSIDQIIYYIVVYMQITDDQISLWSSNPQQFVEDEDDDSFSFSVRISAQDLLLLLCSEFQKESAGAVCRAVTSHLQESAAARDAGDVHWWKIHESCMLAMGSVQGMLVNAVLKSRVQFQLLEFLQSIVLEDLKFSVSPFLVGRCLWTASRYTDSMDSELITRFLTSTVGGLHATQSPIVRISAVRAVFGFCEHLKASHNVGILLPFLEGILSGLVSIATQFSSEVLCLVMESISILITVDSEFVASHEHMVGPLATAVFLRYATDPLLVELSQDVIGELISNPLCSSAIQGRILPMLSDILTASDDKISPGLTAVCLDLLTKVLRSSHIPLSDGCMSMFLPVVHCVIRTDDSATMQSGGEALRAFTSVSVDQIAAFTDKFGNNGIYYLIQAVNKLLDPRTPEFTAAFVGRLCAVVIDRCGALLGDTLDLILCSVLSKMQRVQTISVMQSLLMVFAHLMNAQLTAVLNFLCSVPGPTGKPALEFVLTLWCDRQHLFYGNYDRKVSILALAKLLHLAVANNDQRLHNIVVHGEPIESQRAGVRTRSKARVDLVQWTEVPALVKIYKLLINELSNQIEGTMAKEEELVEDSDDCDDEESIDDAESDHNAGTLTDLLEQYNDDDGFDIDDDDGEHEEDPDAAHDPISKVNLQDYLTDFLRAMSTDNCYSSFSAHHNPAELEVLRAIHINV